MFRFNTDAIEPCYRFEFWADTVNRSYTPLQMEPAGEVPFRGEIAIESVGGFKIVPSACYAFAIGLISGARGAHGAFGVHRHVMIRCQGSRPFPWRRPGLRDASGRYEWGVRVRRGPRPLRAFVLAHQLLDANTALVVRRPEFVGHLDDLVPVPAQSMAAIISRPIPPMASMVEGTPEISH